MTRYSASKGIMYPTPPADEGADDREVAAEEAADAGEAEPGTGQGEPAAADD